jgi:hypothetical protein
MKLYIHYLRYILRHKLVVFTQCLIVSSQYTDYRIPLLWHAITHDIDKFRPRNFIAYAMKFKSGGSGRYGKSWESHFKRSKHHWQYWCTMVDTKFIEPRRIPRQYIIEMYCDMTARALARHITVQHFYILKYNEIIMCDESRIYLEGLLNLGPDVDNIKQGHDRTLIHNLQYGAAHIDDVVCNTYLMELVDTLDTLYETNILRIFRLKREDFIKMTNEQPVVNPNYQMAKDKCINETNQHISRVMELMLKLAVQLCTRAPQHDASKLESPELETFIEYTPKLARSTYGSDEYKGFLALMKPALDHHYAENSHHPEHYENGISGMTLLDLCEALSDWCAAVERHGDGDIRKSIDINQKRFGYSDELKQILLNTLPIMGK